MSLFNQSGIQKNNAVVADLGRSRKAIREAVVEILLGKTLAGLRVFPNATVPPWSEELPVILIYPRSEGTSLLGSSPKELNRSLDLAIEIVASGPEQNVDLQTPEAGVETVENVLDTLAEQVEQLMHADDTLQGTCDESVLNNTEFEFEVAGALPVGSARLTYDISYTTFVPRNADDVGSPFKTNNIDYHISDADNTTEANDTVDLPQV